MCRAHALLVLCLLCVAQFSWVEGACTNKCMGKGVCNQYGRCECAKGWQGADCSEAICPFGEAWSGYAEAIDVGHARAECSNRGICDRTTGECTCLEGFTGKSCDKFACGNACGGVGKCMTIEQYANTHKNKNSVAYGYDPLVNWDANKIRGCVCEAGYYNYDCSLRSCKTGDDPLTKEQVNEIQVIKCTATAGSFVLFYDGAPSLPINNDYTADQVRTAILFIPTITDVIVEFSVENSKVCQAQPNVVTIEFNQDFGPKVPFIALPDDVIIAQQSSVEVSADGVTDFTDMNQRSIISVKGTKENEPCAGRGLCSPLEGTCSCFNSNGDAYASSDGYGSSGLRGDCGFVASGSASTCPGEVQCSGHGVCPTDGTFKCQCEIGWTSGDCSERLCPTGKAWFDYPSADNEAHLTDVECSNMGVCDVSTGMCTCFPGFFGQACEFMSCGGTAEAPCFGHGQCKTLTELAPYTKVNGEITGYTYGEDPNNKLTWDGHRIHHCVCDHGYSGYDCSLRTCPTGDDPVTWDQKPERKVFQCKAHSGDFVLKFRESITPAIATTVNEKEFISLFNTMPTVDTPIIQFVRANTTTNGTYAAPTETICNEDGYTYIVIDFIRNHADLPPLRVHSNELLKSDGTAGILKFFESGDEPWDGKGALVSWDGDTEDDVCSNRGLCNTDSGECVCFAGSYSSDGAGGRGTRPDCGYVENVPKRPTLHFNGTIWASLLAAEEAEEKAAPNNIHPAKVGAFIPNSEGEKRT